MPRRDVTITGKFDDADWVGQITRSTQKAQRAMPKLKANVDERGLRPLGKMMGSIQRDASEFDKSMEAANARVIAFAGSTGIIFGLTRAFRGLVRTTADLQENLTDIQTILQATPQQMRQFGRDIFSIARQTGQSFNVAADAAREFARQGLAMDETLRRVHDSLVLVRVSNMNATTAVEGLTAAINAFSDEAITSTRILNTLVAVETQFAVASNDLIQAIRNAGAIAGDAGVSFNELTAAVTTARQITARTGSDIGNAFRTIFTRVQRQATLEALRELGIETERLDGSLRGTMDILRDVANAYDDLGDVQAAYIAELVGGVFNINILRATLNDLNREFSIYDNALNVATNATDEAIRRNERLNRTLTSLANEGMQRVVELSGMIGEEMIVQPFERGLVRINRLLEGLGGVIGGEDEGEDEGFSFARGFLRGLGNVLSGPAVAAALVAIGRVVGQTLKFAEVALAKLLGIGGAIERQRQTQETINKVLSAQGTSYQQIISQSRTREEAERRILNLIQRQAASVRAQSAGGAVFAGSPRVQRATTGFERTLRREGITNMADTGIGAAIGRETTALQSRGFTGAQARSNIFLSSDPRTGIGVGNFIDEPSGRLSQGVNREIRRGNNPRGFGNFADAIPNFASVAALSDAQVMSILQRHAPEESMRKIQRGESPRRVLSGLSSSFRHPELKAAVELSKGGPQQLGVAQPVRLDPRLQRGPSSPQIGRGFTQPFARGRSPLDIIRASGTRRSIDFDKALQEVRRENELTRELTQKRAERLFQRQTQAPLSAEAQAKMAAARQQIAPIPPRLRLPTRTTPDLNYGNQGNPQRVTPVEVREARAAMAERQISARFDRIADRIERKLPISPSDRRFFQSQAIRRGAIQSIQESGLKDTPERRRAFRREIAPQVRADMEKRRQEVEQRRTEERRLARDRRAGVRQAQSLGREQRLVGRIMMGGIGMSMLSGMLEGTPAGRFSPMLQMGGTGAFLGTMFGGVPGAAIGAGAGLGIGGIQTLTSDLGLDIEDLNKAYLEHQSTIKDTVNATGEFIRSQEAFNNAVREGDELEMRRISGELTNLLSNIGDAKMRRDLINAAGDLDTMQSALSKFSITAQEQERRLAFMSDLGRLDQESGGMFGFSRSAMTSGGFRGGVARFFGSDNRGGMDAIDPENIQRSGQSLAGALNLFEKSDETLNNLQRTIFGLANQGEVSNRVFQNLLVSLGMTERNAEKVSDVFVETGERLGLLQTTLGTGRDLRQIVQLQKEQERLRVTQQNFITALREQDQLLRFRAGIQRGRDRTNRDISFERIEGGLELAREFTPQGIVEQAGQRLEGTRINEEFKRGLEDANEAGAEKLREYLENPQTPLNLGQQRVAEITERLRKDSSEIGNVLAEILKDIDDKNKEISGGTIGVRRELQSQQLELKRNHAELMDENRKANSFLQIQNELTRDLVRINRVRRESFGMDLGQAFLDPEMRRDLGQNIRELAQESARVIPTLFRDPRQVGEEQLGQNIRLAQMYRASGLDVPQSIQQGDLMARQELRNRKTGFFGRELIQASGLGGFFAPGGVLHRMGERGNLTQGIRDRDPEAIRGVIERLREQAPDHAQGEQLNRLAHIMEVVASEFEATGSRQEMLETFKRVEGLTEELKAAEEENHQTAQEKRDDIIAAIDRLAPEKGTTERMVGLQTSIENLTAALVVQEKLRDARGERGRLETILQQFQEEFGDDFDTKKIEEEIQQQQRLVDVLDENAQATKEAAKERLQELQELKEVSEIPEALNDLQEEIKQLRKSLKEMTIEGVKEGGDDLAQKIGGVFKDVQITMNQKFEDAIQVDVIDDEEKQNIFLAKLVRGVASIITDRTGQNIEEPESIPAPRRRKKETTISV